MEKHVVIARRFRPQRFSEVVGQDHITNALRNQIRDNKIPQSVIFAGQRGLGKTTTARIFSKAINCMSPDDQSEPCNQCEICRLINMQSLVDVIEIDGASNRGINEVRILRENALYSPVQAKYKVYIIDEVHMLTREAFNALLKILEEPPSHVVFLMATTEPERIPVTIKSRCQVHYFREITHDDMEKRLRQIISAEKRNIDEESLSYIISLARGSMRDAESILEKVLSSTGGEVSYHELKEILGIFDKGIITGLFSAIYSNDCSAVYRIFSGLKKEPTDFMLLYEMLIEHYHVSVEELIATDNENSAISLNDLLFDIKILLDIEGSMQRTSYKAILLETTVLHIIKKGRLKDIQYIKNMLSDIDSRAEIIKSADIKTESMSLVEDISRTKAEALLEDTGPGPAGLFKKALEMLEKTDFLYFSMISNIPSEISGEEILFLPGGNENSACMLQKPEKIQLFEGILAQIYKKPMKIRFKNTVQKKKPGIMNEVDSPDTLRKDPKIRTLLDIFKADIEKID